MRLTVQWFVVLVALLGLPIVGFAQEATLSGTITDMTGGVLPGVTIVALHEATGNVFQAVTDERGTFRLPVRTGTFRITAELPGFATVTRTGVELLLAQQGVVNLQMAPSTVQETVTVTGEAPLVDVTQSRASGNIDPRQMQELPVSGRNWQDLALLAPGARTNAVNQVAVDRGQQGDVQINVDGQQVTQNIGGGLGAFGQPRFSRDAIAEFEFVANRFDATQGRSAGVQINAITKSGTNAFAGTASGYFRHDRFRAEDFIQHRRLPYSNQQLSGTFGGPIRKDKFHFFANYEYEREPQTFTYTSPFPRFNIDQSGARTQNMGGGRFDVQFSTQTRLTTRANKWQQKIPFEGAGGATSHPSAPTSRQLDSDQIFASLMHVVSSRTLNEAKIGYYGYRWDLQSIVPSPNHPYASLGVTMGVVPSIRLRGYTIGGNVNLPQTIGANTYSFRDDFTSSFTKGGRHDVKLGGEYLYVKHFLFTCRSCGGVLDAQGGPIPANIESLFPVWNDTSTWNIDALSSISRNYTQGIGNFRFYVPRHTYAAWVQDDWQVTSRLTLNLGLRYDIVSGVWAEWVEIKPFLNANRPLDKNNLGPRLGFALSLNDRTVLRGGFGRYFADVTDQAAHGTVGWVNIVQPEVLYDGRANFASNPFNGARPTVEQFLRTQCNVAPGPACVRANLFSHLAGPIVQIPYSWQTSIGVQRQLGSSMAVEADYVYKGGRQELYPQNINLTYNPATGANYPFTDIARRAYPDWGVVEPYFTGGRSNSHDLQMAFTKRLSNRWQASGTYLLSRLKDALPAPYSGFQQVAFPLASDMGGEYTLAATDQRHRAVFNGIWQAGYGFQLSGLYFYGSGVRYSTTYGGDLRQIGSGGENRLRPNGTIAPRNNLVSDPLHRVDLRVQRRFALGGRAGVDGILELFNVFNRANYGSYTTAESNANYGKASQNLNVAYQPRTLQLGFRFTF